MNKLILSIFTASGFLHAAYAGDGFHGKPLTAEEEALRAKGDIMEVYRPDEHSGYQVGWITGPKGKGKVLICNFGLENVARARAQGREMKGFNYTPEMAQQFLFAQGWDESHDRFYTRAYVQEGMNGYNGK